MHGKPIDLGKRNAPKARRATARLARRSVLSKSTAPPERTTASPAAAAAGERVAKNRAMSLFRRRSLRRREKRRVATAIAAPTKTAARYSQSLVAA
jgi:hypothetical protein